jgi:pyruvate dehydrogenase E1 component beta subunit
MPASIYDAKGLMLAALKDRNPVVILDHRYNFKEKGYAPEEPYIVPLGKGIIRKHGKDVTVVAVSNMVVEAYQAAQELQKENIDVEVIDPRTVKPLDKELIFNSVKKTGRLVVVDNDSEVCGIASEISAQVAENVFQYLKAPVLRVANPDRPIPSGHILEVAYYKGKDDIINAIRQIIKY